MRIVDFGLRMIIPLLRGVASPKAMTGCVNKDDVSDFGKFISDWVKDFGFRIDDCGLKEGKQEYAYYKTTEDSMAIADTCLHSAAEVCIFFFY